MAIMRGLGPCRDEDAKTKEYELTARVHFKIKAKDPLQAKFFAAAFIAAGSVDYGEGSVSLVNFDLLDAYEEGEDHEEN